MRILRLLGLMLPSLGITGVAWADCAGVPGPCQITGGEYHIELPPGAATEVPAIMFLHGYGSSGEDTLKDRGMVDAALARGYAVIAPSGMPMEGKDGRSWSFIPNRPAKRDETAFLIGVRDDAVAHHGIDPDLILLAGFSIGGSLTSYVACQTPGAFSAYAPVSGSFWRPMPESCAGPVRLFHTHGWTDTTVPLEGRILRGSGTDDAGVIAQGDVFHGMEIWRAANGCDQMRADSFITEGYYWRRKWERCSTGSALEFALFPGAHMIPPGWTDMALDWFEALPKRQAS